MFLIINDFIDRYLLYKEQKIIAMSKKTTNLDRRQFFKTSAFALGSLAIVGAGAGYLKSNKKNEIPTTNFLRPPGAIDEDIFIAECIKCGLCVQICPIQAIKLADIDSGLDYGTPYIEVREQACDFSCDSLQCVETCPTAVLNFLQFKRVGEEAIEKYDKEMQGKQMSKDYNPFKVQIIAMKEHVEMGMAKLNQDTCLAYQSKGYEGKVREVGFKGVNRSPYTNERKATPVVDKEYKEDICDICIKECPIGEKAIIMEEIQDAHGKKVKRPKVLDGCTGCGVCVMVCPTEKPSIIVEPVKA